ncbi:hypothetical protein HYQ45_013723 [Verticillium longisporum]|uniref:Uncharacterized protein n=1 Tax=Verticillium longisporum TaxID=100787 RepID=A0A8I2ZBY0_VERLO|nr:hypothetical protein HYQ45_013723 [Verticillium longisporum]
MPGWVTSMDGGVLVVPDGFEPCLVFVFVFVFVCSEAESSSADTWKKPAAYGCAAGSRQVRARRSVMRFELP